jgi:hypothetical protein
MVMGMADHLTEFALPGVLAEIARLTSVEKAIAIARQVGGREIYVPHTLPRSHQLVSLLGRYCAEIMVKRHGGSHLNIPSARTSLRWADARELRRKGKSIAEISQALGIGRRRVEQLVEGIELPDRSLIANEPKKAASECPACGRKSCRPKAAPSTDPTQGDLFL